MIEVEFSIRVRVYIEDTDAGGIVFYGNYLKYMERARTELFRELGFNKPAFIDERSQLVVASVEINYKKPARLDQELWVSAKIIKLAKTYIVFVQQVLDLENNLLSIATIKVACVDQHALKPCALPKKVKQALDIYSSRTILS